MNVAAKLQYCSFAASWSLVSFINNTPDRETHQLGPYRWFWCDELQIYTQSFVVCFGCYPNSIVVSFLFLWLRKLCNTASWILFFSRQALSLDNPSKYTLRPNQDLLCLLFKHTFRFFRFFSRSLFCLRIIGWFLFKMCVLSHLCFLFCLWCFSFLLFPFFFFFFSFSFFLFPFSTVTRL